MSHQRKLDDARKHAAKLRKECDEAWTLANQTGKSIDRMRAWEAERDADEANEDADAIASAGGAE